MRRVPWSAKPSVPPDVTGDDEVLFARVQSGRPEGAVGSSLVVAGFRLIGEAKDILTDRDRGVVPVSGGDRNSLIAAVEQRTGTTRCSADFNDWPSQVSAVARASLGRPRNALFAISHCKQFCVRLEATLTEKFSEF